MPGAVLRYPGGKFRARKYILPFFEEDHTIASPFFGGGHVELALGQQGKKVTASELYYPVAAIWQEAKENADRLATASEKYLRDTRDSKKEMFNQIQQELDDLLKKEDKDRFEIAVRAYVSNRTSFSGLVFGSGVGDAKEWNPRALERLRSVDMTNVEVLQGDYWEMLFSEGQTYDAVYADPPYALGSGSTLYGHKGNTHREFDHERFATHMNELKNQMKIVISYNDCDAVRDLFQGWRFEDVEWKYGMGNKGGARQSNEVFIVNF